MSTPLPIIPHGDLFSEVRPWNLVAEIAEINHACGFEGFPERFFLRGPGGADYGNGQQFAAVKVDRQGGELRSVTYKQVCGLTSIQIFND